MIGPSPSRREKGSTPELLIDDVLLEIFNWVISVDDSGKAPLHLSHVSQCWRQLVLASPLLWCNITIQFSGIARQHQRALHAIHRSGSCPVNLTIHLYQYINVHEKKILLEGIAHRIKTLTVNMRAYLDVNTVWSTLDLPMPLLEEFKTTSSSLGTLIDLSRGPPGNDVRFPFSLGSVGPTTWWTRWVIQGLTSLCLSFPEVLEIHLSDLSRVLRSTAATLEHFEWLGEAPLMARDDILPSTQFPQLTSLDIAFHNDIVPLLRLFEAPSLDVLALRDCFMCQIRQQRVTERGFMFDRVQCNFLELFLVIKRWNTIRHLGLFGFHYDFDSAVIVDYMQVLNNLQKLEIFGGEGLAAGGFLEVFSGTHQTRSPILPRLTFLLCGYDDIASQFSAFIDARRSYGLPRLLKLTVSMMFLKVVLAHSVLPHQLALHDVARSVSVFLSNHRGSLPLQELQLTVDGRLMIQ